MVRWIILNQGRRLFFINKKRGFLDKEMFQKHFIATSFLRRKQLRQKKKCFASRSLYTYSSCFWNNQSYYQYFQQKTCIWLYWNDQCNGFDWNFRIPRMGSSYVYCGDGYRYKSLLYSGYVRHFIIKTLGCIYLILILF